MTEFASAASGARAETVVVSGVELRLPPEWERKVDGPRTVLAPKSYRGRAIEVIELPGMPPAKPEAFEALLGNERLDVAGVKEITREGAKVLVATGKLVARKVKADVDVLVVAVERKAAMLVSYVGADQDPLIRSHNRRILESARIPGPRISVAVRAPQTAGMGIPPKPVIDRISKVAAAFDQVLRLPRGLAITFEECGEVNASYNSARHTIRLCHEYYADHVKLFMSVGEDRAEAERLAGDSFTFTFFHELGHAMVGELGLPITGSGEAAADEIATLFLARGAEHQQIALTAARRYQAKLKQQGHKDPYFSTHPFDSVRLEAILCLLYGSDKAAHEDLMRRLKVPPSKLAYCLRDAPERRRSWSKLLAPYVVKQ